MLGGRDAGARCAGSTARAGPDAAPLKAAPSSTRIEVARSTDHIFRTLLLSIRLQHLAEPCQPFLLAHRQGPVPRAFIVVEAFERLLERDLAVREIPSVQRVPQFVEIEKQQAMLVQIGRPLFELSVHPVAEFVDEYALLDFGRVAGAQS